MSHVHASLDELVQLQYDARGFSFLPKQPIHSLLSGRHASRLRGRGLLFEELRDYRPGDDIRAMDWRATARLRKPHVRVYSEERDRPVLVVVDQRATMFFGSQRTTKATAATELAALAAWRAIDAGDRVGAIIFGEQEIVELKPHRSRRNVLRICHELVRINNQLDASRQADASATLNTALRRAAEVARHDHLVVLITDYDGDDATTQQLATRLAAHNDVLAVLVYDPLGIHLPATGIWRLRTANGAWPFPSAANSIPSLKPRFEPELTKFASDSGLFESQSCLFALMNRYRSRYSLHWEDAHELGSRQSG